MFKKIKPTISHSDLTWEFRAKLLEAFPELKSLSCEEIADRWYKTGLDYYTFEKAHSSWWVRLTLPFALVLWLFMFILLPVVYIIRGEWQYGLTEKNWILNWFRALGLN